MDENQLISAKLSVRPNVHKMVDKLLDHMFSPEGDSSAEAVATMRTGAKVRLGLAFIDEDDEDEDEGDSRGLWGEGSTKVN